MFARHSCHLDSFLFSYDLDLGSVPRVQRRDFVESVVGILLVNEAFFGMGVVMMGSSLLSSDSTLRSK